MWLINESPRDKFTLQKMLPHLRRQGIFICFTTSNSLYSDKPRSRESALSTSKQAKGNLPRTHCVSGSQNKFEFSLKLNRAVEWVCHSFSFFLLSLSPTPIPLRFWPQVGWLVGLTVPSWNCLLAIEANSTSWWIELEKRPLVFAQWFTFLIFCVVGFVLVHDETCEFKLQYLSDNSRIEIVL